MIATLALPQAFFRSFLQESSDARGKRHVLAVTATLRLVASFLFVALFTLASVPITLLVFGGSLAELPLIALIGPIVFFDSLNSIPLAFLRAQRRPAPYVTITFTRAILGSILIIFFVVVLDLGPLGVVLGSTGSSLVSASMGVAALLRAERFRFVWDSALVRHMLTFSLPLVPASIAAWGLNLSDRYVIRAFDGFSAAGVYSSGYQAGLAHGQPIINTGISAIAIRDHVRVSGANLLDSRYVQVIRVADGSRPILDIVPDSLHQKTPFVIGSKDDVAFAAKVLAAEAVVGVK
jgi:O-antigen/teichoic acid export membrane protein